MTTLAEVFDALKYRVDVDEYGTRRYYNAAGLLHREDGPAVIWRDGSEAWFHNGKLHRTTGPAVALTNRTTTWWIHGVQYTKQEYQAQLKALEQTP